MQLSQERKIFCAILFALSKLRFSFEHSPPSPPKEDPDS